MPQPKSDKPDAGRFVRSVEPSSEQETVPTAGLLARVEEQAKEITVLKMKLASATKAFKAERAAREKLVATLESTRGEAEDAAAALADLEYQRTARLDAESSLMKALDRCDGLELEVEHGWAQVEQLNEELAWATRPVWRKLLGRPPRS